MDYQALLARVLQNVDEKAYFTPSDHVDQRQRTAMSEIGAAIQDPSSDPTALRAMIRQYFDAGRIDRVMYFSALHVVAASPKVQDWAEAARLVAEQELAALDLGGPLLDINLASVERHRGVLAYLRRQYEVALDYFTRAFERQRTPENLTNILCALLRLGKLDEAEDLVIQVKRAFSSDFSCEIDRAIRQDPDLALLRKEDL